MFPEKGNFELSYGYMTSEKVEIFKSKKQVKKKFDELETEAAVWEKSGMPELVTAKTYAAIGNE